MYIRNKKKGDEGMKGERDEGEKHINYRLFLFFMFSGSKDIEILWLYEKSKFRNPGNLEIFLDSK